ncbi:MAG TPA: triose-phosphate isomerase [Balneolaceae bacterium]
MRRFLIAGNWKMNCGPKETESLLQNIKEQCKSMPDEIDGLVCPPAISLTAAADELKDFNGVSLGAQNVYFEDNGAFTGEVSTQMLNEVGCEFVIVGHSERRQYFGETNKTVNAKVNKALEDGIKPVICVGESLEQRKAGEHKATVKKQVEAALIGVENEDAASVVIAYEPIWAIGTGETASPEQAQEMHSMIRSVLADHFNEQLADQIRILYGGSMKPHNAGDLLSQEDIDGGLIGGASLKADSFCEIIRVAEGINPKS